MQKEEYIPLEDNITYAYVSDLDVSSMLIALGYELVSMDRQKMNKITFIFNRLENLEEDVDSFLSGRLSVNALAFSNARKNLKSMIYTRKSIDY